MPTADQPMTTAEILNCFINGLMALATFLAVFVAIYQDKLKAWLTGPRLHLVLHNPLGNLLITDKNTERMHYVLSVRNRRPTSPARNCRVQVTKVWLQKDGIFSEQSLPYPFVLSWPPSEFTQQTTTVTHEHPVDFIFVDNQGQFFALCARHVPFSFEQRIFGNQTVRYELEIVSDEFHSRKRQVFEVSWNGKWDQDRGQMAKNLTITEVKA